MEETAKAVKCLNNKSNLRIAINTPSVLEKKRPSADGTEKNDSNFFRDA